ncbi:MAG: hypothetical protein QOI99_1408 [Actinomycetota bacterium]|nr:hypothetical protein [Actinomycetota bacterium]
MTGGPTTGGRIYSVGYEGTTVDDLVERLAAQGVSLLIDVRLTPISRRPGFSRRSLAAALAVAGIEYVHEPLLGNPPENRDAFRAGDPAAEQVVRQRLDGRGRRAVEQLVFEARRRRVAVMCVEREPSRCHRRVITDVARELTLNLEVLDVL